MKNQITEFLICVFFFFFTNVPTFLRKDFPFIFNVMLRLFSEHYLQCWLIASHKWPGRVLSLLCKMSPAATHRAAALDHSVWAEGVCGQTEVRAWAGNGQEGIKMSDGGTQSEWGKKKNTKLKARSFSSFILIAQGHFSPFTLSTGPAIRASPQNV